MFTGELSAGRAPNRHFFLRWKLYGKFAKAVLSIHAIFDSRYWNSVKRYFAKTSLLTDKRRRQTVYCDG